MKNKPNSESSSESSDKTDFLLLTNKPGLVYLDSAATSQKPEAVISAVIDFYLLRNANPHRSLYPLADEATAALENARETVARFIGAKAPNSIVFTSGTTMGTNVVAYAWANNNLKAGDIIISTIMEHHANIVPWQNIANSGSGISLQLVGMSDDGILDLGDLEQKLIDGGGRVKLVCVGHVSNVLGTLNPIRKIATLAHRYGAAILVDGAQAMGHMKVNVSNLNVDFYAFSGHKMLGPLGSGALYVAPRRHLEMGIMFGGGDMISRVTPERAWYKPMPYRLEAGTQSVADIVGMEAAIKYLESFGMNNIHKNIKRLGTYAWNKLKEIPNIKLLGPGPGKDWSGSLVSFTFDHDGAPNAARIKDSELATELGKRNICVRSGLFCAQPLVENRLRLSGSVRASFHGYNDSADVDKLVFEIKNILEDNK